MNLRPAPLMSFLRNVAVGSALLFATVAGAVSAQAEIRVVALGDSMVLGYGTSIAGGSGGVSISEAWPAVLERMLRPRGWDVSVTNRGRNGEVATDTLARVESAVPVGTDLTIVMVGGKDLLRGAPPSVLIGNLEAIAKAVQARGSSVLIRWRRWIEDLRDPTTHYTIPKYDPGDHEHFQRGGQCAHRLAYSPRGRKRVEKARAQTRQEINASLTFRRESSDP